jgi:gamma-glutamyltranspeptidase/glutathione hydrolase
MKFLRYFKNILRANDKQIVIKACILFVLVIGLSSCEEPMTGRLEYKAPFAGIVSADEPNAALVGRNILKQGGNAADAAIATAFAMTVTMPSRVGLSGGGICQYYNQPDKKVYTIDFIPEIKEGKIPAPAFVRGMYALYAKGNGNYKWGSLVVPAEQKARFGHKMSKAFAYDIALLSDSEIQNLGFSQDAKAGYRISNLKLADTLSKIRINAGRMYSGDVAKDFLNEAVLNGIAITYDDINSYSPSVYEAEKIPFLNESIFYPKNSEFKYLWDGQGKVAENNAKLKTANFVIADREGSVAACSLSMGENFGLKEKLDDLGIIVASDMSKIKSSMSPLIVVNEHVNESRLAVSGTKTEKLISLIKNNVEQEQPSSLKQWEESGFYCALGIPPYPESCKSYAGNEGKGYSYMVDVE